MQFSLIIYALSHHHLNKVLDQGTHPKYSKKPRILENMDSSRRFEQKIEVGIYRVRYVQIPFHPLSFPFIPAMPIQFKRVLWISQIQIVYSYWTYYSITETLWIVYRKLWIQNLILHLILKQRHSLNRKLLRRNHILEWSRVVLIISSFTCLCANYIEKLKK